MIAKTTDDKKIYYEVIGNLAANETIIFLNGLSQTTAAWGLITPYFEKKYKINWEGFESFGYKNYTRTENWNKSRG